MIVIYPKMTEENLRKAAADAIVKVEGWFTQNPKRRVCRAELWYSKHLSIKRKTVAAQINALLEETLTDELR